MKKEIDCSESKTFSTAAQKNSSVPTISDMLHKKNGGLADQWYLDETSQPSTQPTLKLGQDGTHREQKSSAAWQTWTQLPLTGKSPMFAFQPPTAVHGNVTLEVAVGPPENCGPALGESRRHPCLA